MLATAGAAVGVSTVVPESSALRCPPRMGPMNGPRSVRPCAMALFCVRGSDLFVIGAAHQEVPMPRGDRVMSAALWPGLALQNRTARAST